MISMLRKLISLKLILTSLLLIIHMSLSAGRLELNFENSASDPVCVKFAGSNFINSFAPLIVKEGENKPLNVGLSEGYFLRLNIFDSANETLIDSLLISDGFAVKESFDNYFPAAGNIPSFGCYFNSSKRVSILNIYGIRSLTWLPLCSSDYGRIDVRIRGINLKENSEKVIPSDNPVKFTLFAFSDTDTAEELTVDGVDSSLLPLKDADFNLENFGVFENVSLKPVLYAENDISSRWVDLIIHNYSFNTYILYSFENRSSNFQHISFGFKDSPGDGGIVFYPPHTQRRAAAFRFGIKKNNGTDMVLLPNETERKDERYTLLIGRQDYLTGNILEYIPVEIHSSVYSGRTMSDGVNLIGGEGSAYRVKFTPVNVVFYPDIPTDIEGIKNSVRIPADKNGAPLFKVEPMEKPQIKVLGEDSAGRAAAEYEISAYSKILNRPVKYKLILLAPPFLAGNTPGVYHPSGALADSYSSGNFIRYPLHLYLMELDDNGSEIIITGSETMTGLPEGIAGSIEFFISDEVR